MAFLTTCSCVVNAPTDYETQKIMTLAEQNVEKHRLVGVFTKCDMVRDEPEAVERVREKDESRYEWPLIPIRLSMSPSAKKTNCPQSILVGFLFETELAKTQILSTSTMLRRSFLVHRPGIGFTDLDWVQRH